MASVTSVAQHDSLLFGERLRHLRRERGLTLDALGEKVGKAASYLSLIENGRREAKLSLIEALAGALDVSAADLLAAEPPSRRARRSVSKMRCSRATKARAAGVSTSWSTAASVISIP